MADKGPQGGYEESWTPTWVRRRVPRSCSECRSASSPASPATTSDRLGDLGAGPRLAARLTLVFKPSPRTPLSTMALMRLVDQGGFPKGVINFVAGDADVGELLSSLRPWIWSCSHRLLWSACG